MERRRILFAALALGALIDCGGAGSSGPSGPGTASTPVPAPTPPAPAPTPTPTPTPCTQGLCEDPVTNTAPAVTCGTRLYWVKRPGSNEIFSDCREDDIPLGWQFALDSGCKDKDRRPTNSTSNTRLRWEGTDRLLQCNSRGPFQVWCVGVELGHFQHQFTIFNADGQEVRATWLHGDIVPPEESSCGKK
jgi:hypothetical protein